MNDRDSSGWEDLASLWQGEVATYSMEQVKAHSERQRRIMQVVTVAELAGAVLGITAALWLMFVTPHRLMGLVVVVFALLSAVVMLRARREPESRGEAGLIGILKESVAYHDWMAEQLRYGRALSFVALFAIVMSASVQLLHFQTASASGLAASASGACGMTGVLAWNFILTERARRRRASLQDFCKKLEE